MPGRDYDQRVLLARLKHAIATGGLLVVPGCGAETSNVNTATADDRATDRIATTGRAGDATTHEVSTSHTSTDPNTTPVSTGVVQCDWGEPQKFCLSVEDMKSMARYGTGQARLNPPRSDTEIAAAFGENGCMRHDWIATGCCNPAEAPGVPQEDGSCCYVACQGACCGRPLVVNGHALVAGMQLRADWIGLSHEQTAHEQTAVELPLEAAQALANAWLTDGLMEHASVASFARFALDLMALGAPPQLLVDAHRAALDEINHAERCFAIASRLAGKPIGPGPLPTGLLGIHSLSDAVRATIAEGCIGETLAAGIAREQATVAVAPEVQTTLLTIAEDELRHAELAWRFVAWAIKVGGDPVRQIAEASFEQHLSSAISVPEVPSLDPSLLNYWGRLSEAQWRLTAESLVKGVLAPAARALFDSHLPAVPLSLSRAASA